MNFISILVLLQANSLCHQFSLLTSMHLGCNLMSVTGRTSLSSPYYIILNPSD